MLRPKPRKQSQREQRGIGQMAIAILLLPLTLPWALLWRSTPDDEGE